MIAKKPLQHRHGLGYTRSAQGANQGQLAFHVGRVDERFDQARQCPKVQPAHRNGDRLAHVRRRIGKARSSAGTTDRSPSPPRARAALCRTLGVTVAQQIDQTGHKRGESRVNRGQHRGLPYCRARIAQQTGVYRIGQPPRR